MAQASAAARPRSEGPRIPFRSRCPALDYEYILVIGLTGSIGTGKSEAARVLRELGAEVINADEVGHEAYTPHTDSWNAVVDAFGPDILQTDGEIDRRKLGAIVFADPGQWDKLNEIAPKSINGRKMQPLGEHVAELRARF